MVLQRALVGAVAGCAAVGLAVGVASPAQADAIGGSDGNSMGVGVSSTVVISGDAGDPLVGGGSTSISVSVPPKCWWEPFNTANFATYGISASDPKAMKKYLKRSADELYGSSFVSGVYSHPEQGYINSHTGKEWQWYTLESADGVNCATENYTSSRGSLPEYGPIPVSYAAFGQNESPPPPLVNVEDVVLEVWDAVSAEVAGPEMDRNPQIDAAGGSTLVNLATWFWVQNVQESLAGDGEIHLEVSIPGTPVQASLDSSTDGVQITSPAGATQCSVEASQVVWSPGTSENSACTIPFDRANRGGWPVTAQTTWTGTWEGTDHNGPTGGALDTLAPSATIQVPVAESEALVNDVG